MRAAIITDNDFDNVNGVTATLRAVLRHLPSDIDARVYTFAGVGVDAPEYRAFRSTGIPSPYYGEMQIYLPRLRRLHDCLAADRVDLVHLTTPGPAGLAARAIVRRTGLPMLGSYHTQLADYTTLLSGFPPLGTLMGRYVRWLYRPCREVLVPSRDTRTQLIASGWQAERLAIWPRGVDASLFSPDRQSRVLRERWRVSERRPAVLYVGRVSREKGLHLLQSVESLLFRHRIAHRFVVVGDGPMLSELKDRLPDAVFTGALSPQDVAAAMASADVFLFPSDTDTAGNVVLEAQATGLPVLVSARGGPKENMIHGETGYVCRPGDPLDFAERLGHVLSSQAERRRLSENARAYASTRTWRSSLESLFAAYRALVTHSVPDEAARFPAGERAIAKP